MTQGPSLHPDRSAAGDLDDSAEAGEAGWMRERWIVLGVWSLLALALFAAAVSALGAPGMFYDEAWLGQQARRFVRPDRVGLHAPGASSIWLFGRPFPLFALPYLGSLKSQLAIPALALFGDTLAVLRLTTVAWTSLAILLTMLWARRAFGLAVAVAGGALIALDPAVFFSAQLEWGPFSTGLLCRALGFWLLTLAWQRDRGWAFVLAGLALGMGVYNRADFVIVLAAVGLGLLAARPDVALEALRERRRQLAGAALAFLLAAAPILMSARAMFETVIVLRDRGDFEERLNALGATLDGSYFYRLMQTGGRFDSLFLESAPQALGAIAVVACLAIVGVSWLRGGTFGANPALRFLSVSTVVVAAAMLGLPGATRAHHMLNLCPLSHLLVAATLVQAARGFAGLPASAARGLAASALALLLVTDVAVIASTRALIGRSGGRGLWSDAIFELASELENEPGANAISLDWGFHLPLLFLTQSPKLLEPYWRIPDTLRSGRPWSLTGGPQSRYLVHDERYDRFGYSPLFLEAARALDPSQVEIRRHRDREGSVAFLSVRFSGAHRITLTRSGRFVVQFL